MTVADLYDGPIIDAHHHLWTYDAAHYPWLGGDGLDSLRRDIDAGAYRAAAGALDVRGTVWVEALASDPLAEAVAAQRISVNAPGLCNGIVARVPLTDADVEAQLEALRAEVPNLRGIRDIVAARPAGLDSQGGDILRSPAFLAGLQAVAQRGLVFDLLVEAPRLREATLVLGRVPNLKIVVEHAGSPDLATAAGIEIWRDGLAHLARLPQAAIKISALHCRQPGWSDDGLAVHIRTIIDLFGTERVAFASDFPVHDRTCPFEHAFLTFRRAVRSLPPHEQRRLFKNNALRLYDLRISEA